MWFLLLRCQHFLLRSICFITQFERETTFRYRIKYYTQTKTSLNEEDRIRIYWLFPLLKPSTDYHSFKSYDKFTDGWKSGLFSIFYSSIFLLSILSRSSLSFFRNQWDGFNSIVISMNIDLGAFFTVELRDLPSFHVDTMDNRNELEKPVAEKGKHRRMWIAFRLHRHQLRFFSKICYSNGSIHRLVFAFVYLVNLHSNVPLIYATCDRSDHRWHIFVVEHTENTTYSLVY